VILPGSKQTLRDLASLRSCGMADALQAYVAQGGQLFALCGGLQMLGKELHDPEGLEGDPTGDRVAGLGLLPLRTVFQGSKALRQRRSRALWPPGQGDPPLLEGFELHQGLSEQTDQGNCAPLAEDDQLGWWAPSGTQGGLVAGTYLHGIFENGPWRRRWLNQLRQRRQLPPLEENQPHHARQRDALLDRLADAFEAHIDLAHLLGGTGT
jgi:adenosylcobyric acid synthase